MVQTDGASAPGETCDLRTDRYGAAGAHVDTAYFCASAGDDASVSVRYVFEKSSSGPARFAVIPVVDRAGELAVDARAIAEATINGGGALTNAPVLVSVEYANEGGATSYRIRGTFLENVADARIWLEDARTTIPIQVMSRAADELELSGPLLEHVREGLVEVRKQSGLWTAIPIAWSTSGLRRTVAPQLLIQVDRASLTGPSEPEAGDNSIRLISSVAEALRSAGAVSLHALHPAQPNEPTTNLIGEPIEVSLPDDWFVATLAVDADITSVMERVQQTSGVVETFEDRWQYLGQTNDPLYDKQWGLQNISSICGYSNAFVGIGADFAWNQTTGSPNVRIGILDTGINPLHEDFGGRVMLGPNCLTGDTCVGTASADNHGHGTAVAGIAAASGNNGVGVAGATWQSRPVAIKVLNESNRGQLADIYHGLIWAYHQGIPILNMSLGGNHIALPHSILAQGTLAAFKRGQFLVAASGNTFDGDPPVQVCPADLHRRVYTVGAVVPVGGLRWRDQAVLQATQCTMLKPCMQSNFGPYMDAMAPGGQLIATTGLGNAEYHDLSSCVPFDQSTMGFGGTSAATAFVSGTAALLLSRRPELIGEDIAQILNWTSPGPHPHQWDFEYGWGRVSAILALNYLAPRTIAHWGAGVGPYSLGPLQVADSTTITSRQFRNVPGLPSVYTTRCARYRLTATLTFPFPFSDVKGWARSSGTRAWKDVGPYLYHEEVDTATASFTNTSVTVEAFVFRVMNAADTNQTIGWFPTTPGDAHVAFTVVGIPSANTAVGPANVGARLAISTLPNPTRGVVTLAVDIPRAGHVRTTILDVAGRRVATVVEGELSAGRHEFRWDGRTREGSFSPAGIYFCRVDCGGLSTVSRFMRLSGS